MDEFDRVLSTKLTCAKKNVVDNETKLDELSTKLEKIEETRKEVKKQKQLFTYPSNKLVIL